MSKVPHHVRKRLNLPGPDEGIDLIAETKDDRYWAIQCKYREDETKSLTRKELSTFTDLTFGICKNIELALVCTSADRFSHKLKMYGERLSFCAGDVWRGLEKEFFKRLCNYLDGKTVSLNPLRPRKHQNVAIQQAHQHFVKEKNSRGKLIHPCGTGKTLTAYWLARKLKARTILLAVPSLALIRQTLEVWTRESVANQQDVHWIAVCSDETVGDFGQEDVAVLTQDLGVRIHTDPGEIANWLKDQKGNTTVVFTTYQSSRSTADAARRAGIVFDIGIMDEAHKTVGKKDGLFSHLLYDENIKIKKRIFMTATERRYRGNSNEIASMDDPDLYGETFELLSFKKALESRPAILSDYKIVTIHVTRNEVARLIKRNVFVKPDRGKWDADVEAESFAAMIALRKAMQKYPIRHAISFHNSIARAKVFQINQDNFSSTFPEYGGLDTFHVSGKMPTAARSKQIDTFEAVKRGLITNARCLTDGVDVPNIDCILFADPRKSAVDIVQAVGRALRAVPGKKFGYVVVPVLLDDEVTDGIPLQKNAFDAVMMTLRALGANDERIIEYFRSVSQGRRWKGGTGIVNIDVPENIVIDAEGFINSVKLQFWSRLAKLSWRDFEEARAFVHSLMLKSETEWRKYRKGKLPEDIPTNPNVVYKGQGWKGMGDWLGTGTVAPQDRKYLSFKKARAFVHNLRLMSRNEWSKYCKGELTKKGKLPENIPTYPQGTYKDSGWNGWGDWLGTGTVAPRDRKFRSFKEARVFVRSLGLKSNNEWGDYCKGKLPEKGTLPQDIPTTPGRTYKDSGWTGMGDWLGTYTVATFKRKFRSYKESLAFVNTLGLKSEFEWKEYIKDKLSEKQILPKDIPKAPKKVYKDQWISWGNWLGTGTVANRDRQFRPFTKARDFVRCLGLRSQTKWIKYCNSKLTKKRILPNDIPTNPQATYKDNGWKDWGDWLGTDTVATQSLKYSSFKTSRAYVRRLNLNSKNEWKKYCKGELPEKGMRLKDIPANPQQNYKDKGWKGMRNWLGTGTVAPRDRKFRPFKKARAYIRKLGLKSVEEWREYCKDNLSKKVTLPKDIPANPRSTYKDSGWKDWMDWLGTGTIASQLIKYRSFKEARDFAKSLGLQSLKEWKQYCEDIIEGKPKKPEDIPAAPNQVYKNKGWQNWRDWLGTGTVSSQLRKKS